MIPPAKLVSIMASLSFFFFNEQLIPFHFFGPDNPTVAGQWNFIGTPPARFCTLFPPNPPHLFYQCAFGENDMQEFYICFPVLGQF